LLRHRQASFAALDITTDVALRRGLSPTDLSGDTLEWPIMVIAIGRGYWVGVLGPIRAGDGATIGAGGETGAGIGVGGAGRLADVLPVAEQAHLTK
jgi:hypothetical protein